MGKKYNFRCFSCNHELICSNGPDRGFKVTVEPYFCKTCKTVENLVTGRSDSRGGEVISVDPICYTCNSSVELIKWDLVTCPKCNKPDMKYHYLSIPWD